MNKTIEKLKRLQKLYILYTISIFFGLIGTLFLLVKILVNPKDLEQSILLTCFFALFLSLFLLVAIFRGLNILFKQKAKKIIIKNLLETYKNLKINIEYSFEKRHSKNINNDLLKFVNDLLVLNTSNNQKYLYYAKYGYYRSFSIYLEDEFIIELEDQELKKITIEVIEAFLEDIYSKKNSIYDEVKNFKGIILSTKLNTINNNTLINPIIIYENKIFIDPEDISFLKYEKNSVNNISYKSQDSNQILNLGLASSTEIVKYKDMNYTIYINEMNIQINSEQNDIKKTVYILYPKDEKLDSFIKIALKIAEKLYINNNFDNSFAVISNDTLYIFLNHKDNIFKDKDILEIPFYLFLTTKNLENITQDFKNQIETILKLVT